VTGEEPAASNKYNHNFRNTFCGCNEEYDPHQEKGTMFQCLGLGTVEDGGCGEDWWHPECVLGLSREAFKKSIEKPKTEQKEGDAKTNRITKDVSVTRHEEEAGIDPDARRPSVTTAIAAGLRTASGIDGNDIVAGAEEEEEDGDTPLPPGFPAEDDFEYFLCYKCVESFPWIKKYASSLGFLPPVYFDAAINQAKAEEAFAYANGTSNSDSKKRKVDDDEDIPSTESMAPPKRQKSEDPATTLSSILEDGLSTTLTITSKKADLAAATTAPECNLSSLPPLPAQALKTPFSLFLKSDFHAHLCHCATCFPLLKPHPQLLEEEDVYEPPISEDGNDAAGSVGTGSLLERGEAAFSNMDRARAIQGAMAFANLKDGLKAFLKPYADEGKAVGAEDINVFFQKLRGDDAAIKDAAADAKKNLDDDGDGADGDNRREQSGY
jgi:E3 ubiquitin-protein ligase UBR7